MKGFYTKQEAASILGVSVRQINNYFNEDKLTRVYQGKRAWVPKKEVEEMYARATRGPRIKSQDVFDLQDRVEKLEREVGVLKLGLGFGSKRNKKSTTDLVILRQRALDDLSKKKWGVRRISEVADLLMTMQEEEISDLLENSGATAWVPLCDLSHRMLLFLEGSPEYPDKGLDVLHTRLMRARDRFYGLIYASTQSSTGLAANKARKAYDALQVSINTIEDHVLKYLTC